MIPGYGAEGDETSMYCLYSGTRTIISYNFEKEQSDDTWSNSFTSSYTKAELTDAELGRLIWAKMFCHLNPFVKMRGNHL